MTEFDWRVMKRRVDSSDALKDHEIDANPYILPSKGNVLRKSQQLTSLSEEDRI
jgi:hypothetical protein